MFLSLKKKEENYQETQNKKEKKSNSEPPLTQNQSPKDGLISLKPMKII
jgi:hypothetical protein